MSMFAASLNTLKKRATELVKGGKDSGREDEVEELGPPGYETRETLRTLLEYGQSSSDEPVVVRYEVQNGSDDDRESAAFLLPVSTTAGITTGLVRGFFPVPGRFHFRFKAHTPENLFGGFIWIDACSDSDFAPAYKGEIYMRALRIPDDADPPRVLEPLPGDLGGFMIPAVAVSQPQAVMRPPPPPEHLRSFEVPSSPARSPSPSPLPGSPDLSPMGPPPPAVPAGPPPDLMEMEGGSPAVLRPAAAVPGASPAAAVPQPPPPPPVVFDRAQLVAEREARERQAVEDAVKRQVEQKAKEDKLKADKVSVSNEIGMEMDKWAKTGDGQAYKDIKVLLSTMHTVLWPNSGWSELPLSELVTSDSATKRWYRKAILVCHPDKQKEACPEQQVRADRIFQALNEAFKVEDAR